MQIYLLYRETYTTQTSGTGAYIILQSMNKELQQLLALCKVLNSVHIKTRQLVHKRRTPSAVRFVEGSCLTYEGAEVGLVLLLGRRLVPVALCRE